MHLLRQIDAVILAVAMCGSWIAFIQLAWRVGFTSWLRRMLPRYLASAVDTLLPLVLAVAVTALIFLVLGERLSPN